MTLYVRFALKFDQPIPLSVARLKQISQLTEIHHEALSSDKNSQWATQPLMELIIKNCTQGIVVDILIICVQLNSYNYIPNFS